MEVKTTRNVSIFRRIGGTSEKNQVCRYWLQGRCNRNPCKFMHRESPPPNTEQAIAPAAIDSKKTRHAAGIDSKQTRHFTWKNNSSQPSNKGSVSRNSCVQAQKKVSGAAHEKKVSAAAHEKNSIGKAQATQCKYWVDGNCVHGDKCKLLHSWFCGSGFSMLAKLEGHGKAITGISLPSGSNKLFSGGKDQTVRVWDCSSGQCAGSVATNGVVGCLATEGPWLFAGLQNAFKAWNLNNNTEVTLNGPAGLVCRMVVDEDKLFAGLEDGTILVWKINPDTKIPEPAAMVKEHKGAICSLVIGANRLYSGSKDTTIKVWDLQNMLCLQTLSGHAKDVTSLICWDSYLLSGSLDNTLKIWSASENGTIQVTHEMRFDHGILALCGIHDAEVRPILLCSLGDSTVRLYDLPLFTERGRIFSKRQVEVIEIGVDGLFFTGDATGDITVWKLSQL